MEGLSEIATKLLGIDLREPSSSESSIVLHVIPEATATGGGKKEWLHWGANDTFRQFMQDILYKIDGEAIAIYPGDYVRPHAPAPPA